MTDKGLTAWEALQELHDQSLDFLAWADRYDHTLVQPLIDALANGEKYATGWREGSPPGARAKTIEAALWGRRLTHIDFADDSAGGPGGLCFVGLRIHAAPPEDAPGGSRPKVPRRELKNWLTDLMAGPRMNQNEAESAARKHFEDRSVVRTEFRDLYKELRPESWGKLGPR